MQQLHWTQQGCTENTWYYSSRIHPRGRRFSSNFFWLRHIYICMHTCQSGACSPQSLFSFVSMVRLIAGLQHRSTHQPNLAWLQINEKIAWKKQRQHAFSAYSISKLKVTRMILWLLMQVLSSYLVLLLLLAFSIYSKEHRKYFGGDS